MFNGHAAHACILIGGVLASDISQCKSLEPFLVDAILNNLVQNQPSQLGRINFCEGFAFDLADFQ